MLGRLLLLFVLVPLVELALLVRLGQWLGLWPTLGLVLLTGTVGAALARSQGARALARIQAEVAAGRLPGDSMLDGMGVLVGGLLLLTPGVLTDIVGFALLLPAGRGWLRARVKRWLERRVASGDLRVAVFGAGSGGFPFAGPGGPGRPGVPDPHRGLDPRNEIRLDE